MASNAAAEINPATERLNDWLEQFSKALTQGDSKAAAAMFDPNGFWRDFVAFTWNCLLYTSPSPRD